MEPLRAVTLAETTREWRYLSLSRIGTSGDQRSARELTGSFPRKRNKNDGETVSSEQVILDISFPLVTRRTSFLLSPPRPRERASEQRQRWTGHPLAHYPPRTRATKLSGVEQLAVERIAFCSAPPYPVLCFRESPRREEMTNKWAPLYITATAAGRPRVAMAMRRDDRRF